MASNTENLNLLMKNPSTDGADTFNVQTMLNDNWQKIDNNAGTVAQALANILKPTTPPIIGLPPSTTPDGMFQALGNTGELHVWRKTVKNAEDVPAGYTLGEVQNVTKYPITDVRSGGYTIVTKAYSNLSVDDAGNVSVDESSYVNFYDDSSTVRGKFIQVYSKSDILFIPNDANISTDYKTVGFAVIHNHYTDKYQTVTGYPLTPAGTTTTYHVSTNPNAYQEGDDAKAAGYVVGEVKTGQFSLGVTVDSSAINRYNYSSAIAANDDGTISLLNSSPIEINGGNSAYNNEAMAKIIGKYIALERVGDSNHPPDFDAGVVWFIPADATYGNKGSYPNNINYVTKRQPVTGYAAIPAGTTIEYLGKLGDKARVQVVSYVGTGTYGSSNPNSLTFDFAPKMVIVALSKDKSNNPNVRPEPNDGWSNMFLWIHGMAMTGISQSTIYFTNDGKKLSWYASDYADSQCNESGSVYTAVAIG